MEVEEWLLELEAEGEGKEGGVRHLSNHLPEGREVEGVDSSSNIKAAEQRQISEETCKLTSLPVTWVMFPSRLPQWGQKGRRSIWQL